MADMWTRNLRGGGGDVGATPRQDRAQRQPGQKAVGEKVVPTPADKERPFKAQTPLVAGLAQLRMPSTLRKMPPLHTDSPENQSKPDSPTKPPSEFSGDGDEADFENDSVRVFVRVRPVTPLELAHEKHEQCLSVIGSRTLTLAVKEKQNNTHHFNFDQVLPEATTQQDVFDLAGVVAVDNCLAGYNSSIFAYGQTGSGKTFTIIGQISNPEKRGLAPRVFEYLFSKISENENVRGVESIKYNCRASFLEIYNEQIGDLLNPSTSNLPIREDPEKGPYVEGLTEPPALNVDEMLSHLLKGAENRHTGETRLNHESSRSHSVFVCTVEKTVTSNGISKCFYAKLNLVDLAGSERIASGAHGGSNVTGEHFKEACNINKSLTALGRVTTELVKSQKSGCGGHVPYRDSKLTFLLQSSLGGNAKTLIIANVSPSSVCSHETLSTLRFAKQTKHIRNDAKVNWTVQGDRQAMQREIDRLRVELMGMRSGVTEPLVQANEDLSLRLEEERQRRDEVQQERDRVLSALNQARRENRVLDQRLVGLNGMSDTSGISGLSHLLDQLEVIDGGRWRRRAVIAEAEQELMEARLRMEEGSRRTLQQLLNDTEQGRGEAVSKCGDLEAQLLSLSKEKTDLEESCSVLADNFSQAGARISEQKEQLAAQQASLHDSRAQSQQLEAQLAEERTARQQVEQQLVEACTKAVQEAERVATANAELQLQLRDKQEELAERGCRMEGLERQLEGALAEMQQLQSRLAEVQEQLAQSQRDSGDQVTDLTSKLEAAEARAQLGSASLEDTHRDLQSSRDELARREQRLGELEQQLEAKVTECSAALKRLAETESGLSAQTDARSSADSEVASLVAQLAALRELLSATEGSGAETAQALQQARCEAAELKEQLAAKAAAVEEADGNTASARQEVADWTARTTELEASAAEQATAQAALLDSLRGAEREVAALREEVERLQFALGEARGEHSATVERATSLSGTVEAMNARAASLEVRVQELESAKADLEAANSKQSAEAQDRATVAAAAAAALEARLAEMDAVRASLAEQLEQEQSTASTLREAVARNEISITELRQQVEQEEARALNARRDKAEAEAAAQRQMAQFEEQHLQEVQSLKDDLDRRNVDLKSRDQEMIRSNFALKGEIDRLQAGLEQTKRELNASKANQEQLIASQQVAAAGVNERLTKQTERYNELSKRHDAVKQLLDTAQREIENWKTKSERLDLAMADVTRLIRFARNPPDSARSSLIMTRSDHLSPNMESARWANSGISGSRNGMPSGAGADHTPGSLSLRITESPAESPRMATSRYSNASPAGSKMGSVAASHRIDDDGEEWQSRRMADIHSPGDQLPIPDMDE